MLVSAATGAQRPAGSTSIRTATPGKVGVISMWLRPPGNPRDKRNLLSRLQAALTPVTRPNVAVILWRWRYELGLLTGLPVAAVMLTQAIGAVRTAVMAVAVLGVIALWPPARRLAIAEAWCVITPHRIRTGCVQAWIHSRHGKIPFILLTRRQPWGESVLLWCRGGTTPQDFFPARSLLAAACWARDVSITLDEHHAQLVTLHVIRRDGWHRPPGPDDIGTEDTDPDIGSGPTSAGPQPGDPWSLTGGYDGQPRAA